MRVWTLFRIFPFWGACVIAKANLPALPEDLTTPFQQRLAIYGPNSISIGWNTYTQLNESCIDYGTSANDLNQRTCASTTPTTYPTSRTYENVVILSDLTAGQTYYYHIASANSSVEHFLSPRLPGDPTPFSINAVIDLGVYGEDGFTIAGDKSKRDTIPKINPALNHTTIGRLASTVDDYEFIIHPGDFAYADDWYLSLENLLDGENAYQAILENFYTQLSPISGRKAYMASPGNHEAACQEIPFTTGLCPDGQKNFTDFMHRFGRTMPSAFPSVSDNDTAKILANQAKELASPPFWYSFEYGMVHVTMINTETDFIDAPDSPGGSAHLNSGPFGSKNQQLQFLEADLASVDRDITPWVIVAGHRPWYTSGTPCLTCQLAFEDIFYKYGVDIAVFGHEHNAQRYNPIYQNVLDPNGLDNPRAPMYIVAGGAGNIEGLSVIAAMPMGMVWGEDMEYTFSKLGVLNRTHLGVEFWGSGSGEVLDECVLVKGHGDRFVRQ